MEPASQCVVSVCLCVHLSLPLSVSLSPSFPSSLSLFFWFFETLPSSLPLSVGDEAEDRRVLGVSFTPSHVTALQQFLVPRTTLEPSSVCAHTL